MRTWFWWGNMKEIDHLEDLGVHWVVIIKCNKVSSEKCYGEWIIMAQNTWEC